MRVATLGIQNLRFHIPELGSKLRIYLVVIPAYAGIQVPSLYNIIPQSFHSGFFDSINSNLEFAILFTRQNIDCWLPIHDN